MSGTGGRASRGRPSPPRLMRKSIEAIRLAEDDWNIHERVLSQDLVVLASDHTELGAS